MGRRRKLPQGTYVERKLFESKAYFALVGSAPQVLLLLLGKRQFETVGRKGKEQIICTNCDSLIFTYIEEEKKYGLTQPRVTRAIDELLAKGFLTIKHLGGEYPQDKSIYALSDNWQFWSPGAIFETRPKDTRQRGFRGPKKQK